jgi:hypothetical protein
MRGTAPTAETSEQRAQMRDLEKLVNISVATAQG